MSEGLTLRTGELAIDLVDGQLANVRVGGARGMPLPSVTPPRWPRRLGWLMRSSRHEGWGSSSASSARFNPTTLSQPGA